ncbi:MAG: integrase arm-type DNA-binding domain-containing protein [Thermodesulfobacteriota bacterium]
MPKSIKQISALRVKQISKAGTHAAGGVPGLLLQVKPSGAKSWVLRVMVGDRRRCIGLGGYPAVTLSQAIERARAARDQIHQGIDPIQAKKARQRALRASGMTFREAAEACFEKKRSEFRNEKHAGDWLSSVANYAYPVIGDMSVEEIALEHVLSILRPIWEEKTETATRLRQRIENIIDWAIISGHRSTDNCARWKGYLEALLPKPTKIKRVRHMPALPYSEINGFIEKLRVRPGISARCLEFVILTACRSGEARGAKWSEIDGNVWTIPAERTKTKKEHVIPLSKQAMKLLKSTPRFPECDFIFPNSKNKPLSDMALLEVCRGMKVDAVPHGFRSTFRDWSAEQTNYAREVCEQSLGHAIESKVEAAYRRGDLLDKRRRLMQSWSDYCDKQRAEGSGGQIVAIGAKK